MKAPDSSIKLPSINPRTVFHGIPQTPDGPNERRFASLSLVTNGLGGDDFGYMRSNRC